MNNVFLFLFLFPLLGLSNTITVGISTLPSPSDAPNTRSVNKSQVLRQIYDSLFITDEFGKLKSSFFKQWSYDSKTHSYDFTLKNDVKFSDGTNVQAADIIKSIERGFKGEFNYSKIIASVRPYGSNKIVLKLRRKDSSFLVKLTDLVFAILKDPILPNTFPLGTGIFKISEANLKKIVLTRNEHNSNYSLGNINQINYILVENSILNEDVIIKNKLDFFPFFHIIETDRLLKKFKRVVYPSHRIATLVLNIKNDDLRNAIASCIDTYEISNLPYFKFDTQNYNSIIPSGIENYQSSFSRPSFNEKNCISKIKNVNKKNLIWLNTYNSAEDLNFLNNIAKKINKMAGFEIITINTLSLNDAQAPILHGEYDIFMCSISPPIPLVDRIFTDFIFSEDNPNSLIKYPDKTIKTKFSLLQNQEYNNRAKHIKDLEVMLLKKNWVLPIGRKVTTFYIPNDWLGIENLNGMNGNFYLGKIKIND